MVRSLTTILCTTLLVASAQAVVTMTWLTVGDPGNPDDPGNSSDPNRFGSVPYTYRIASTAVTIGQFAEFLNAVGASDPNGIYSFSMHIDRSGSSGSFTYAATLGMENRPAIDVSWNDAARFANWMHNGQPTAPQGVGTTEYGAYDMTLPIPIRLAGATMFLPSEDEWYKAAYYDPRGSAAAGPPGDDNYWLFPTQSDSAPLAEAPPGGSNSANYNQVLGSPTDVGAYVNTTSFYGAFDMGGNIWEWNEAIPVQNPFIVTRGQRGGAYNVHPSIGTLQSFVRLDNVPFAKGSTRGFRLASIPEPSVGCLVLLGLELGLGWRRRRSS